MTQQSYPNKSEEVVASGASTSSNSSNTLSTDVYPLPFSLGQKEVVWNNEERALVPNDNNVLTSGANICVNDSNDVTIGNHTFFNGDVTIYQNIQNTNLRELPNVRDEVECNKNAWHYRLWIIFLVVFIAICLFLIYWPLHNVVINETPYNDSSIEEVFIPRSMWGGDYPLDMRYGEAASLVIIKHTGGKICFDFKSCSKRVRELQEEDMSGRKMVDIEYNFIIGGDGRIYVGRDWYVQNEGWSGTIDIAFIGNFTENEPTEKMINASRYLIAQGSAVGAINYTTYHVVCDNQTKQTDSPGENLFREVYKWRYYHPGIVEMMER